MFEKCIQEILTVRGQLSIAKEYGSYFYNRICYYSKLTPDQLTFRFEQITHLKWIAETLDLPTSFIVALLGYKKFEEE